MTKKLTESEAQAIIKVAKIAEREMQWQAKKGNYNPTRYEFHTVLRVNNEIREDLFFRAQYRGKYQHNVSGVLIPKDENISVGLYAANQRIFAYDYDTTPHTNHIGVGKAYFFQTVPFLHQHIWTDEGYGYAEPLTLTSHDLKTIIEAFLQDSHISIPNGFQSIPQEQLNLPF